MLDPELTDAEVRRVIDAIGAQDRTRGQHAELVWDGLTAGEGPGMVTQAGLQNWLWWLLPKRASHEVELWSEAASAGAELFERLGVPRYAAICAGDTTAQVFTAWTRSAKAGVAACRKAQEASGVEPPALDDFAWNDVFEHWELTAREHVERALEVAIDEGELRPGEREWRQTAQAIARAVLDEEMPGVGQSLRTLVHSERAQRWAAPYWLPADQHPRRQATADQVLMAPELPDEATMREALAPLLWLVDHAREGAPLTASHYLAPALVREAAERFGWQWGDKAPRSEVDVVELGDLRDMAGRMRLVRRRGKALNATALGRRGLGDPGAWWDGVVAEVGGEHEHEESAAEELAMLVLGQGRVDEGEVRDGASGRLSAQNWQVEGEAAHRVHFSVVVRTIVRWELLGIAGTTSNRWQPGPDGPRQVEWAELWLTPFGDTAVRAWLHRRVCGARDHPA